MSAGTADGNWTDLSTSEVAHRLFNRGMSISDAFSMARLRDDPEVSIDISRLLDK